eukprot:TRINITY_DN184_c0_g2_i3.p1 TRINITY_DN184_c0_g2~~TRINITY_DN184_c0_g2_i3.p1  ORF type:complete len:132 (+),score=26.81 TRINITY_DN184_c0_g2_i3:197-592(+)
MKRQALRQLYSSNIVKSARKPKKPPYKKRPIQRRIKEFNDFPDCDLDTKATLNYECIKLRGEHETMQEFKLFKEEDLTFLKNDIMGVELQDMWCDNDCQTENEQIESSRHSGYSTIPVSYTHLTLPTNREV